MLIFKKKGIDKKTIALELINNSFYFLSAFLVLAFISDLLVPGLFALYFNLSLIALLWLLNLIILLAYVPK